MAPLILVAVVIAAPLATRPPTDWHAFVTEASARFGVPNLWIERVIQAESGGRTFLNGRPIRSRAGAIGLMQLMPATWEAMRRDAHLGTDPDDPHDNILAGAAYLRQLYLRFGYPGLFAAYNAGPARYADHLVSGRKLPNETIGYLAKVGNASAVPQTASVERPAQPLFAIDKSEAGHSTETTVPSLFVVRK